MYSLSIYFKDGEQGGREREWINKINVFCVLSSYQGWARLMPGASTSIQASQAGSRDLTNWVITHCRLACTSRRLESEAVVGLEAGAPCWLRVSKSLNQMCIIWDCLHYMFKAPDTGKFIIPGCIMRQCVEMSNNHPNGGYFFQRNPSPFCSMNWPQ